MPQVDTQQFGPIEYVEEDAITFPLGLPAFEQETSFLLVAPAKTSPLVFLQSLGRPERSRRNLEGERAGTVDK